MTLHTNSSASCDTALLAKGATFSLEYQLFHQNTEQLNTRIIDYVTRFTPAMEDEQRRVWLSGLAIYLDDEIANPDSIIADHQCLRLTLTEHFEQPVDCQWQMLWQNSQIMAVYKPAPLAVSRTTRHLHNTLIGLVRRQTPHYNAQLLHRLDIETSGVILLSKNSESDRLYKPKIKSLIEEKIYHAIVHGAPVWQTHTCENFLAERKDSEIRCKMYVVDEDQPADSYIKPKQSKTSFEVLETQGEYSLIECRLHTGRKHQIRAHLAHLSLPIVGDKIYAHQGRFFLKRLTSESGLSDDDYQTLKSRNHLLRAVQVGLRLSPDEPLITIRCDKFHRDIRQELITHS